MLHIQGRNSKVTYLKYAFSLNLNSGESHANENVTVRVLPGGTVTEAATAAPMDDPGSDGLNTLSSLR